jgi:hypothetical protein
MSTCPCNTTRQGADFVEIAGLGVSGRCVLQRREAASPETGWFRLGSLAGQSRAAVLLEGMSQCFHHRASALCRPVGEDAGRF